MPGSLLLALDTSSPVLYMGLYWLGETVETLAETQIPSESQRYHSAILMPELEALFAKAGKTVADLNGLAIQIGPGSFTGIRTGLISARALGQFLPITTYAINAFELLAFTQAKTKAPAHFALDARRGRAYHAAGHFADGQFSWEVPPALRSVNEIIQSLSEKPAPCIGHQSLQAELQACQSTEALFEAIPATRWMAQLIHQIPDKCQCSWEALLPLYLEEPNITLPKKNPAIIQANTL